MFPEFVCWSCPKVAETHSQPNVYLFVPSVIAVFETALNLLLLLLSLLPLLRSPDALSQPLPNQILTDAN